MPRTRRLSLAAPYFHVAQPQRGRTALFLKPLDYRAFLNVLREGLERYPVQLLAYCVLPNHWHLVLEPAGTRVLSHFMQWVTATHAVRWHRHRQTARRGSRLSGPLSRQGRRVRRRPRPRLPLRRAERAAGAAGAARAGLAVVQPVRPLSPAVRGCRCGRRGSSRRRPGSTTSTPTDRRRSITPTSTRVLAMEPPRYPSRQLWIPWHRTAESVETRPSSRQPRCTSTTPRRQAGSPAAVSDASAWRARSSAQTRISPTPMLNARNISASAIAAGALQPRKERRDRPAAAIK